MTSSSDTAVWVVAGFLWSIGVPEKDIDSAAAALMTAGHDDEVCLLAAMADLLKEAGVSLPIIGELSIDSTTLLNPAAAKTVCGFSRDGMSDLSDDITCDQKGECCHNIALIGNPGSGKSNPVCAAAECLAFHRSAPVLWVGHRHREETWNVRFFLPSQGETKACAEILEDQLEDLKVILSLEKAQQVEVLALDAPTRSDDDSAGNGAAAFQWAGGATDLKLKLEGYA